MLSVMMNPSSFMSLQDSSSASSFPPNPPALPTKMDPAGSALTPGCTRPAFPAPPPPLPDWVLEEDRVGVHKPEGSWSPSTKTYVPRSDHSVYERQLFPELVLGETPKT